MEILGALKIMLESTMTSIVSRSRMMPPELREAAELTLMKVD
jgi:hypothetical protein